MTNIQNTRKFRELVTLLRDQAALHGITMMPAEAIALLADRISAVANQAGVTQRWALDRYINDDLITMLTQTLAAQAATYREAASATEPVTIDIATAGHLIASLGMVLKIAAEHIDQTQADSIGIITDGADALVSLGAAIRATEGASQLDFGGQALTWTRRILVHATELLRTRQWTCPCPGDHGPAPTCTLVPALARDLNLIGGWLSPDTD